MSTDTQLHQNPEMFLDEREKRVNALVRLWSSSIAGAHLPTKDNFFGWLDSFGLEVAAAAIQRTAHKARKMERGHTPMDACDLERYTTGTMKRMAEEGRLK
jgi:hypothetical protein